MINIDNNLCYAWPSETEMYSLALGFSLRFFPLLTPLSFFDTRAVGHL